MIVNYGGLQMKLVRVVDFARNPILSDDGTSYLFTEFVLTAVGLVNSQQDRGLAGPFPEGLGMSYKRGIPDSPFAVVPDVEPNTNAPQTDKSIRHWLSVPRRTLTLSAANTVLLQSPKPGYSSDAHNGPVVDNFNIQAAVGDGRTFIVSFQIRTWVNECEENEGKYAALLANRWSQFHEINEQYELTCVTEGHAYLRTDLLYKLNVIPDQLREFLFLPVPVGFQRENVQVKSDPSNSLLTYSFTDVQKPHQFVVGDEIGATKIDATYRQYLRSSGEFTAGILGVVDRIQNWAWTAHALSDCPIGPIFGNSLPGRRIRAEGRVRSTGGCEPHSTRVT